MLNALYINHSNLFNQTRNILYESPYDGLSQPDKPIRDIFIFLYLLIVGLIALAKPTSIGNDNIVIICIKQLTTAPRHILSFYIGISTVVADITSIAT
jgi:hypothetical protein